MAQAAMSVPVWLLTGPLGAGKTTLLKHLLHQKPAHARWGVLINDLSAVSIDDALLDDTGAQVHHLPGGCICCALQEAFVEAIDRLAAERPDAIWIEPTGMGEPHTLAQLLREHPGLTLRGVIAVLDAAVHTPEELQRWDSLMNMVTIADGVVVNQCDRADPVAVRTLTDWLNGLWPPKQWVHATEQGRLPLERVERMTPWDGLRLLRSVHHGTVESVDWPGVADPPPGCIQRVAQQGERLTLSWLWTDQVRFDWRALAHLFEQLSHPPFGGVARAKGVLRTGEDRWTTFQWAGGRADRDLSSWRRDSRLILVLERDHTFDVIAFEHRLALCMEVP